MKIQSKIRKLKNENYKLKRFIKGFYFPNPSWDNLPIGFPNCETHGLSKEEKYLFDAIKFAWITSQATTQEAVEALINLNKFTNTLINSRLTRYTFSIISVVVLIFGLISLAYYIDVKLNLGLKFLSEIFA